MNHTSTVAMAIGSGSMAAVRVRALARSIETTRGIASQRLGELSATDVERIDPARAALEQDIGEAAGRGAHIERDQTGKVDLEGVERGGQLVPATTHVRVRLGHRDGRIRGDQVTGLSVVPGGVAVPYPDRPRQHERLRSAACTARARARPAAGRAGHAGPSAWRPTRGSPADRGTARFTGTHRSRCCEAEEHADAPNGNERRARRREVARPS